MGESIRSRQDPAWQELRACAEGLAAGMWRRAEPGSAGALESALQELLVIQVEMEIQNLELRRARDELEASREKYFDLFDSAAAGFAAFDGGARILDANATLERLLGFRTNGLLRRNLVAFFPPDEQDYFTLHWRQVVAGQRRRAFQARMCGPGGKSFRALVELAPASPETGAPRYRCTVLDLTCAQDPRWDGDREQAARAQARRLHGLSSLARGTAHVLYRLLASIAGRASGIPARAREAILAPCERGKAKALTLVHFAQERVVEGHDIDLNVLVEEELAFLATDGGGARPEVELAPDLHAVRGDPATLGVAFLNLVVNAQEALGSAGTLAVRTLNEGRAGVILEVEDTGPGMALEVAQRATEPFFTTKSGGLAAGLGLTVAFETARAHGGRLAIDSAPGRGTTVRIHLPASPGRGND